MAWVADAASAAPWWSPGRDRSLAQAAYPGKQRAGAIGIWATASGLGFGLGPLAGGLLIESFGWSSIFWVNVPLGIADLIQTLLVVPESKNPAPRALNVPSVILAALGLAALTLGFTSLSSDPITSPLTLSSLAARAVLACLFVWSERRSASPMIPAAVIRSRPFDTGCAVYFLSYTALTGVMFYLTLLYQNVNGWSPLETGLSWLAMNVPYLAAAQLTGRLARAWPGWVTVACGCMSSAVGVIVLSTLSPASSVVTMSAGLALLGLGNGMLMPGVTNVAMRDIPPDFAGTASGVLNTARQAGTSIGLSVLGAVSASVSGATWARHASHGQAPGRVEVQPFFELRGHGAHAASPRIRIRIRKPPLHLRKIPRDAKQAASTSGSGSRGRRRNV
jgi:MFS family permease